MPLRQAARVWALVIGLFAAVPPAGGATTRVIDFEKDPAGSPIASGTEVTSQFAPWGVTFTSAPAPGASHVTTVVNYIPTTSGSNSVGPGGPSPNIGGTLILSFNPAVVTVGSAILDDQMVVRITAKDPSGNVVGVATSNPDEPVDHWTLSTSSRAGITRVELAGGYSSPGAPDGWVIDDLRFEQVPEPGGALLGTAALALALRRRRRPSPLSPAP